MPKLRISPGEARTRVIMGQIANKSMVLYGKRLTGKTYGWMFGVSAKTATGNVGCHPFSGADFGIVYGIGSHALLWNIRYADYGDKLSVLRPFYYDFHLFSGHRKSGFQHGNSIMQATAFPCSILMVSGQMVPSERNLACIPCRGNWHLACCSHNDGLVSP